MSTPPANTSDSNHVYTLTITNGQPRHRELESVHFQQEVQRQEERARSQSDDVKRRDDTIRTIEDNLKKKGPLQNRPFK